MDFDKLHSGKPEQIAARCYALLTPLHQMQPHEQLQALSLCLTTMSEALGVPVQKILEVADSIRADAKRRNVVTINALVDYIHGEMR